MLKIDEMSEFVRIAAGDVFATMLGMELQSETPRLEKLPPAIADGVLAIVGVAGRWSGAGAVSCTAAFACRICARFLTTESGAVDEEVLDAMGEVTNMVVGNFKTMLEQRLGPLGLSIPTVIYGRNFISRSLAQNDWLVVPFRCEQERLEVRVCLAPSNDSASRTVMHGSTLLV